MTWFWHVLVCTISMLGRTGSTTSSLMKVWPWLNNIGPPILKIPPRSGVF
ncbi:hypothetical protein PSTT_03512 [Puccinia striiformis]|uniref:Uncharacterized protein n=1 Tax=Puccinia striiformis TaxID=27350 RepID=A0A2S4VWK3_9BASI|nr:hypothetical protein PSTT_03512 [Puccinia striiformis]